MKDPVCGMTVDPKTSRRAEHRGQTYCFCGEECMNRFKAEPERYTIDVTQKEDRTPRRA